ncbi:MAG: hypothetical protein JXB36_11595, partial [Gammaproteobacteria bacterium]|nr:hypothetical protein [Gammaproteobacteria bacterium]
GFIDHVERLTGRRVEFRGRGRPKGAPASPRMPSAPVEREESLPPAALSGAIPASLAFGLSPAPVPPPYTVRNQASVENRIAE